AGAFNTFANQIDYAFNALARQEDKRHTDPERAPRRARPSWRWQPVAATTSAPRKAREEERQLNVSFIVSRLCRQLTERDAKRVGGNPLSRKGSVGVATAWRG